MTVWKIPPEEAVNILDGLVASGLFELPQDKDAAHALVLTAGGWRREIRASALPDEVWRLLLPILKRADPEIWRG